MTRIYLLAFDPYKTDSVKLHEVIKEKTHIKDWWHYIGSTYLIASDFTLATVHNDILKGWPKQRYLLIEVDPKVSNGWLPPEAWAWIHKYR
jgi:hypothetical protein